MFKNGWMDGVMQSKAAGIALLTGAGLVALMPIFCVGAAAQEASKNSPEVHGFAAGNALHVGIARDNFGNEMTMINKPESDGLEEKLLISVPTGAKSLSIGVIGGDKSSVATYVTLVSPFSMKTKGAKKQARISLNDGDVRAFGVNEINIAEGGERQTNTSAERGHTEEADVEKMLREHPVEKTAFYRQLTTTENATISMPPAAKSSQASPNGSEGACESCGSSPMFKTLINPTPGQWVLNVASSSDSPAVHLGVMLIAKNGISNMETLTNLTSKSSELAGIEMPRPKKPAGATSQSWWWNCNWIVGNLVQWAVCGLVAGQYSAGFITTRLVASLIGSGLGWIIAVAAAPLIYYWVVQALTVGCWYITYRICQVIDR